LHRHKKKLMSLNGASNFDFAPILGELRSSFDSGRTLSLQWRKDQLKQFKRMLTENLPLMTEALRKDLGQTEFLASLEILKPLDDIYTALKELDEWTKPEPRRSPLFQLPGRSYIHREPFGVVLILGPWNYPFNEVLLPMVGAIAAGNCCVLKPSEISVHSSKILKELVEKYFDQKCIRVIEGAIPETTALLNLKFDFIFYTGSTRVGKIIYQAAAKNLTPVALELGGKCPAIVDTDCNLQVAVARIAWGKFLNSGQTCVAPDYILVHKDIEEEFKSSMKKIIHEFYGDKVQESPDYSRIINEQATERIQKLLEGTHIYHGGMVDKKDRFVEPTIIDNVSLDSPIMNEEIFGPIVPVIPFDSIDWVIKYINKNPKPLAVYVFGKKIVDQVIKQTSSGAVVVNDVCMQAACKDLPFGGVGGSGFGRYHGKATFDTFSNPKGVLEKWNWPDPSLRYPPYTPTKIKAFSFMYKEIPGWIPQALYFALFAVIAYFIVYSMKQ